MDKPQTTKRILTDREHKLACEKQLERLGYKDKSKTTPLQQACIDLNAEIDAYWNSDYGIKFTGMGENFIVKITAAQQACRDALEAEGVKT